METLLRQASNIQYIALLIEQHGKKRKRKEGERHLSYHINKAIARSIRVRHMRHPHLALKRVLLVTSCADDLRFRVQESLEAWYGPAAASLRLQHQGDGVPVGSGEDLGLFWNVAVSNFYNVIPALDVLHVRPKGKVDVIEVPLEQGGSMLPHRDSLLY